MKHYYKVCARGGHVGAGNEIELIFYIQAKDMLTAIKQAKNMPCVKHNKQNAITKAVIITKEEYNVGRMYSKSAYSIYNNKEGGNK